MGWEFPILIKKDIKIDDLDVSMLEYWHNEMHILWSKLEEGLVIPEWDFWDVYIRHKKLIVSMKQKGLKHITPINSLDVVRED